ncbi:MAG: phosphate acyltransferase PlsX [bacterium]|nr:phosphate acyltransferase PlsX [bacterium]MDE0238587.1 phosphate acyltransferase PlsX [bacterium]MDE0416760.1 phosphate acyltransferase PlsX [bacterium]
MSASHVLALDAMGGDRAPGIVVAGANLAMKRFPDARFRLVGKPDRIGKILRRFPKLANVSEVVPADVVIESDMKPSLALRRGAGSSMKLAIDDVRSGRAAGVVSAGNTGAMMAMAKLVLRTLPGIRRPAIASTYPTLRGQSVMLDLGANIECDADDLVQFAIMGAAFARSVQGLREPTVGLLNVGSEEAKGHGEIRRAAEILKSSSLPLRFHGFIEGNDITEGTVDVVVADGFSGNIALKTFEGTANLYTGFLRATFRRSVFSKLGYLLAKPALMALKNRVDPRRYNGGMFLGLNGVAVKSHGGTDARGFANAIGFALDMMTEGFNDKVILDLRNVTDGTIPLGGAATK